MIVNLTRVYLNMLIIFLLISEYAYIYFLDVLIISCVLFYDFIIDIYDMIVNNFNMKIIISNWQSH